LKDAHNRPFLRLYGILTEGGKGVSSHSLANAFAVVAPEIDTVFRNVTKSADVVETQVSQPIKIGSDVTIDKTLLPTIAAALAGAAILLLLLQNASLQSDIRRLNREVGDLLGFINRMSPPARSTAPQSLTQPEPPSPSPSGSLAPAQPTAPVQRR
jgi:hypothetical protein